MPDGSKKIIKSIEDWQQWTTWLVSYKNIEAWTGIKFFETSSLSSPLFAASEGDRIFINSPSIEGLSVTQSDSQNLIHRNTIPLIDVFTVEFSHNRFFVEQFNELSASTDTITEAQSSFMNESSFGYLEISIFKNDPDSLSIGKNNFPHIGSCKIRTTESTVAQVSSPENSVPKIAVHNVRPIGKVGITEVRSSEIAVIQDTSSENHSSQIQPTKITFSSSVSSQQLFSSHLGHNQTSQLVTNIKSSTTNIRDDSIH